MAHPAARTSFRSLVPLKTHTFFYISPVAPKQRPWRAPLSRTVPTDLLGSPWQPHRSCSARWGGHRLHRVGKRMLREAASTCGARTRGRVSSRVMTGR